MSDADRKTDPPSASSLVEYDGRPDVSSFPPSVQIALMKRFDGFDERLLYVGERLQEVFKGQGLLAATFTQIQQGSAFERAGWSEALNRISTVLINLEANSEIQLHEIKSVKLEQARQGQEIERLKDAFAQLRKTDDVQQKAIGALTARLDALSALIETETAERRSGNGNGNGDH
jgi:uncharacterized coiled-coil protein SlyX